MYAALIALRFFGIDSGSISLPDIKRYIGATGEINGFSLWDPNEDGLPRGMAQAGNVARRIILTVTEGQLYLRHTNR